MHTFGVIKEFCRNAVAHLYYRWSSYLTHTSNPRIVASSPNHVPTVNISMQKHIFLIKLTGQTPLNKKSYHQKYRHLISGIKNSP